MRFKRVLAGAALAAVATGAPAAFAQSFNDALVQAPNIQLPTRGSVTGALSNFALSADGVARGAFSLPSPLQFPSDRGRLLANVAPTYSTDGGLTEWGMGWQSSLSISRYRTTGALDYSSDDFTGPWGPMKRGSDGNWYPVGFAARVRMTLNAGAWTAVTTDGTRYEFEATERTPRGTFRWHLARVFTVHGDATELSYFVNSSGRAFLSAVVYGARGHTLEYRLTLAYDMLATPFASYKSGYGFELDRRVRSVTVEAATSGGYQVRWRHDLTYQQTPLSPVFYLTGVQQVWASGQSEPSQTYTYDFGDATLSHAHFQHIPELDHYLQVDLGGSADGIQPSDTTPFDLDRDGRIDLEHHYRQATVRHGASGWVVQATPMAASPDPACRPAASTNNAPRHLARLRPQDTEVKVFHASYRAIPNQTEILVCDRPGARLQAIQVVGNWDLGANTRLTDVNRDLRPDVVQVTTGQVRVLENTSDAAGYSFAARPAQALTPSYSPSATWIHDMNGDGWVDLVGRYSGGFTIWWGRGDLTFETQGEDWLLFDRFGSQLFSLAQYGTWFVDANNDGLTDVVLSRSDGIWLYFNRNGTFEEHFVPGLSGLSFVQSNPVFADLDGSGNAQVVFAFLNQANYKTEAHRLALNSASTGLLKTADDGKGARITIEYERADPAPNRPVRPSVVSRISYDYGASSQNDEFAYLDPALHSESESLLGYRVVQQTNRRFERESTYYHDDDVRSLRVRSETREPGGTLTQFEAYTYTPRTYLGLSYRRPATSEQGWVASSGQSLSETTHYLGFGREFCPVNVEVRSGRGTLRWQTQLASVAQLDNRHCLPARLTATGTHPGRASLDFVETQVIGRNAYGQVLTVDRDGSAGLVRVQTVTYDAQHRLATVFEPSGDGVTLSYDPTRGTLQSVLSADGVRTEISRRDALTDLPLEISTHRGAVVHRTGFAFDGRERLSARWNSFNGTSQTTPEETIDYGYPSDVKPGFVYMQTLVDPSGPITTETAELINGDGQKLASIDLIPQGWSFSEYELYNPEDRQTTRWARGPIAGSVNSIDFAALYTSGNPQVLSVRRTSVFKDVVHERLRYPNGISGTGTGALAFVGTDLVFETDFEGRIRKEGRDAVGRILWREDATTARTRFEYDVLGRVVEAELASGLEHTVEYDAYGRIHGVDRDEIGSLSYRYDNAKNLLHVVDVRDKNGVLERNVEHDYDSLGRKVRTTFSNPSTSALKVYEYIYDGTNTGAAGQTGHLTGIRGPDYDQETTYNPDGTVQGKKETYGGRWTVEETYTYFVDRRLKEVDRDVVDLTSGVVIDSVQQEHRIDEYGRLSELWINGSKALDLTYDLNGEGRLRSVNFNGGSVSYVYDDQDTREMTGHSTTVGGRVSATAWQFDRRGQIASEELQANGNNLQQVFTYDNRGFLTGAASSAGVVLGAWTYDQDGLTDQITDSAGSRRIQSVAPGVVAAGPVTYQFDDLGRVIERDHDRYEYGPDGQLAKAHVGSQKFEYGYDDSGRRVVKKEGGRVLEAYVDDGVIRGDSFVEPVRIDGKLIGIIEGGQFSAVHTDARGTLIMDEYGVDNFANPYGVRANRSRLMEVLDFVQKGYDPALGTVRMGVRDYDPFLGRFRTPDPLFMEEVDRCIDSPVECNLYGYARNNPLSWVDPTGTLSWKSIGSIAQVVGEVAVGFTPAGVILDVVDLAKAVHSGNAAAVAVAAVGFVPGGDLVKAAYKARKVAKAVRKAANGAESAADITVVVRKVEIPCKCFAAGTLVRTEDGDVPIESVEVGTLVWSRSSDTGQDVLRPVRSLHRAVDRPVVDIELQDDAGGRHSLRVTSDHPVWVEGLGWTQVRAVRLGEHLATVSGSLRLVGRQEVEGGTTVFNFEVDETSSYFAGPLGLLSHNCKGVDLELSYKDGWTKEQRRQAKLKAKKLTKADTKVTRNKASRNGEQAKYREKHGLDDTEDADHIVDLQLGGKDVPENLWPLDKSVNRSMGASIRNAIKDLPDGTKVGKVKMVDRK